MSTACSYKVRHIAHIFNYENKPIITFYLRFECSYRIQKTGIREN